MANSDEIDVAVVSAIKAISNLASVAPGGVFMSEVGHAAADPFVVVTLQSSVDHGVMQTDGIAFEEAVYLVKVVGQDATKVRDGYRLVHAALEGVDLAINGYTCMDVSRTERVTYAELDGDARWVHRGGLYRVCASH